MGNYELDVAVEDADFARSMEEMFLLDLENCTEVVLSRPSKVGLAAPRPSPLLRDRRVRRGSMGRAGAGTIRIGYTVGAALTENRLLGHAEAKITGAAGLVLLVIALAGFVWPLAVSLPLGVFLGWLAVSLLIRTYKLYFRKKREREIPAEKERRPWS